MCILVSITYKKTKMQQGGDSIKQRNGMLLDKVHYETKISVSEM